MSQSGLLMQIQSDLIGIPVLRPAMAETTALGAAIAGANYCRQCFNGQPGLLSLLILELKKLSISFGLRALMNCK